MVTLGNPFDTMKRFCLYSQCSHLKPSDIFSPVGGCSEGLDRCVQIFLKNQVKRCIDTIFPACLLSGATSTSLVLLVSSAHRIRVQQKLPVDVPKYQKSGCSIGIGLKIAAEEETMCF